MVLRLDVAYSARRAQIGQGMRRIGGFRTFRATVDKLSSFREKVFGDVQEFLDLVGHVCDSGVEIERSLERRD